MNRLFEAGSIGSLKLGNRIIMPAMTTNLAREDGSVSEKLLQYYVERAKGGVGFIIVEGGLNLDNDKSMTGLRELTREVKAQGAKVAIQLFHSKKILGVKKELLLPALSRFIGGLNPAELDSIARMFVSRAQRAKEAGFDGIEINAAHGTTLSLFLSKGFNKRTDEYGRSWEGRTRFLLEIIQRVRSKVGKPCPLIVRINADDFEEGGNTVEDAKTIARKLEAAGIDALSISAGIEFTKPYRMVSPMYFKEGWLAPYAQQIKQIVHIPVIVANRINDPELAHKIVFDGMADFVAMGRALIADPEFPQKASAGKYEEINRCIGCCQGCYGERERQGPITCLVNPSVGKEKEHKIDPAKEPKKVLVAGGGPAGMEVARVAAMRGHEVILCEKTGKLGGQFRLACASPHKDEFENLLKYLEYQMKKHGVKIELGKEVTLSLIGELKPDVIILATGALPYVPPTPGIEGENVYLPQKVLAGEGEVGGRVVVVGGGLIGIDTAAFIAGKGKKITITSRRDEVGMDLIGILKDLLTNCLRDRFGVKMLPKSALKEIKPTGLIFEREGSEEIVEGDTFVISAGMMADTSLASSLEEEGIAFYAIGDCVTPRDALAAMAEGAEVGRKV